MKSKKLISLLLAGAMSLPFAFWTASAEDHTGADGDVLSSDKNYTYTADTTIMNETFDTDTSSFVTHALYGSMPIQTEFEYSSAVDHTGTDGSGSVKVVALGGGSLVQYSQGGVLGIEKAIGATMYAGKKYIAEAWVKGTPGRQIRLAVVSDKYFNPGAYWWQSTTLAETTVTTSNEWQKILVSYVPAEDTNENYHLRLCGVNNTRYYANDEFYFDDVVLKEQPSFELVSVTPDEGTILKAGDSGITAEFSLPLSEECTATVTKGKGVVVNSTVTVENTRLNIAIPSRDHGETYTVSFDKIISVSGDELAVEKTYTYTADTTIMNQTFDEDTGTFGVSDWKDSVKGCYDYSTIANRTPGKDAGSVRLYMYSTEQNWMGGKPNYSANFGIDSDLGKGIEAGRKYVVSAYVKGEPGRYIDGFKFQMGIYRLNEQTKGSYVHDVVAGHPVELKVSDEWQKMSFVWTAPSDLSDLKLRINPVYLQHFNSGADNYDIFYIDDVSIMPVGNVPSAYLSDVAVTYTDGETTKAVATAADLNGKAVTVSATLTNLGANAQPYTLIAAVYDENGKLIDVKAAEGSMGVGSKADITVTGLDLTNVSEAAAMKIFAWDRSNNTQTPLTGVYNPF